MKHKSMIALLAIGAGIATYLLLDQQNILPWSNNPQKQWIWQRIFPAQTARAAQIPMMFAQPQPQRLEQAMPQGLKIIPATEFTSTSTGGYINGQENTRLDTALPQLPRMNALGKYR